MVTTTWLEAAAQPPLLVEVRVSVTVPAVVSALLGTYIAPKVLAFGENVPVPLVVHIPEPVLEVPLNETESLLAQTVIGAPALSVGGLA